MQIESLEMLTVPFDRTPNGDEIDGDPMSLGLQPSQMASHRIQLYRFCFIIFIRQDVDLEMGTG